MRGTALCIALTHAKGNTMGSNRAGVAVKERKRRRIKNDRKIAEAARKRAAEGGAKAPAQPPK
jgi:hypothetical protein